MVLILGLPANCPGLVLSSQLKKLPRPTQKCQRVTIRGQNIVQPVERIPGGFHSLLVKHSGNKCVKSMGRDYDQLISYDDGPKESFWLNLMKEAIWALKSLFIFLVEQPSQLKYIEWPSFQSTLKTATLTLVLVALLIVALSSVDSALSYLLALLLRRIP